ncbi:MAG: hypothetical protein ACE5G1_02305 [bacterium]
MVGVSAVIAAGEEYSGGGPPPAILVYFAAAAGAGFTVLSTMIGAASGSRDIYVFAEKKDEKAQ